MSRTSPSAERTIRIVELLSAQPDRPLALADITRQLGLSHATAHALMTTLTDCGWVTRWPDRSFSLGPALIGVGDAARRATRVVDVALPFMEALAEELELECQAGIAAGAEIVVVARTGRQSPYSVGLDVGTRLPLSPPVGMPYVAWSPATEIDAYIDRAVVRRSSTQRKQMLRMLEVVRARGYGVALDVHTRRRLREAAERGLDDGPASDELSALLGALTEDEYSMLDFDDDLHLDVTSIGAPVFDSASQVVLVIGLVGFPPRLASAEIPTYAARLMDTTAAVTDAIHGVTPVPAARPTAATPRRGR